MKASSFLLAFIVMLVCFSCKKEKTNTPPQIDSIELDTTATRPGGTINIQVFASDADGDLLSYKYFPEAGTITGSGSTVTWNAPDNSGNYNIEIEVSDGKDTVTTDQTLSVTINNEPIITEVIINPDSVLSGGVANVTVHASDPDGDALAYVYAPSGGTISGSGPSVNWIAPYATGTYSINVTVSDGYGGTATASASIIVNASYFTSKPNCSLVV